LCFVGHDPETGYDHAANGRFVRAAMKIASFNINNINRRLTNLLDWLREAEPDIGWLQELKAADTEFSAEAI
jgi:hypothetical protein